MMINWNFAPRAKSLTPLLITILLACLVVSVGHILNQQIVARAHRYQHQMIKRITLLQPQYQQSLQLAQTLRQAQQQVQALMQVNAQKTTPLSFLQLLNKTVLSGIYFDKIAVDGKQFNLAGKAETQSQVKQLQQKLIQLLPASTIKILTMTADDNYPPYRWSFVIASQS